ncbi:hypothetical protein ACNVED_11615 [Legionella sp. D16C41]|uniref:hypothetical protein n=1 Tax=Legionella sp. D16C41 TaxID=3402688 RepID=UPI003AF9CFAD
MQEKLERPTKSIEESELNEPRITPSQKRKTHLKEQENADEGENEGVNQIEEISLLDSQKRSKSEFALPKGKEKPAKGDLSSNEGKGKEEQPHETESTITKVDKNEIPLILYKDPLFYNFVDGVNGYSLIVLNVNGIITGINMSKGVGKKPDPGDDFLQLAPDTIPSEDGFSHAFAVFGGYQKLSKLGNNPEPVQVIVMRGFVGTDSGHFGLAMIINRPRIRSDVLKKYNIEVDKNYIFSGECSSNLVMGNMRDMLGYQLTGIRFNLKGQESNKFRQPNVKLISYIPKSLIVFSPEFDKLLEPQYEGPEERAAASQSASSSVINPNAFFAHTPLNSDVSSNPTISSDVKNDSDIKNDSDVKDDTDSFNFGGS